MNRRLRAVWAAAVVLAVGGAGAWWYRAESHDARAFVLAQVERADIQAAVTATGTLNAVTTVQVGTYVSGPIREIYVDWNTPVKRGEVIAKIDPDPFEVKVLQAEAAVATAHAKVEKATADRDFRQRDLERKERLVAGRIVSEDAVDEKRSAYRQAEAQLTRERAGVAQAEAGLSEARINLKYTDIVSPVDGVVLSRNVDVGQTVAASFQTPTLFVIAEDLAQMCVNANINESDIGRISSGQSVVFTVDAYPEREFSGTVRQQRDSPIISSNVVTYDVVIDVENADLALKPGMTATVSITTDRRGDVLVVPLRSLRFRPDLDDRVSGNGAEPEPGYRSLVWVLQDDGKVHGVDVKTGIRNDEFVEVVAGELASGEKIALAYERE